MPQGGTLSECRVGHFPNAACTPNGITEMQQIIDAFKIVYDHIYDLRNAAEGELVEEKKLVL
jgi:hypothetical protein